MDVTAHVGASTTSYEHLGPLAGAARTTPRQSSSQRGSDRSLIAMHPPLSGFGHAWIYVLRGHPTAKTTADLDPLVGGAADATVMPAFWVGAGNRTAEGLRYYQPGDRDRVTPANSPGQVTVCVAQAEPTSPTICQTIAILRTTPEVRDGHWLYPAIPLIVQRSPTIKRAGRSAGRAHAECIKH